MYDSVSQQYHHVACVDPSTLFSSTPTFKSYEAIPGWSDLAAEQQCRVRSDLDPLYLRVDAMNDPHKKKALSQQQPQIPSSPSPSSPSVLSYPLLAPSPFCEHQLSLPMCLPRSPSAFSDDFTLKQSPEEKSPIRRDANRPEREHKNEANEEEELKNVNGDVEYGDEPIDTVMADAPGSAAFVPDAGSAADAMAFGVMIPCLRCGYKYDVYQHLRCPVPGCYEANPMALDAQALDQRQQEVVRSRSEQQRPAVVMRSMRDFSADELLATWCDVPKTELKYQGDSICHYQKRRNTTTGLLRELQLFEKPKYLCYWHLCRHGLTGTADWPVAIDHMFDICSRDWHSLGLIYYLPLREGFKRLWQHRPCPLRDAFCEQLDHILQLIKEVQPCFVDEAGHLGHAFLLRRQFNLDITELLAQHRPANRSVDSWQLLDNLDTALAHSIAAAQRRWPHLDPRQAQHDEQKRNEDDEVKTPVQFDLVPLELRVCRKGEQVRNLHPEIILHARITTKEQLLVDVCKSLPWYHRDYVRERQAFRTVCERADLYYWYAPLKQWFLFGEGTAVEFPPVIDPVFPFHILVEVNNAIPEGLLGGMESPAEQVATPLRINEQGEPTGRPAPRATSPSSPTSSLSSAVPMSSASSAPSIVALPRLSDIHPSACLATQALSGTVVGELPLEFHFRQLLIDLWAAKKQWAKEHPNDPAAKVICEYLLRQEAKQENARQLAVQTFNEKRKRNAAQPTTTTLQEVRTASFSLSLPAVIGLYPPPPGYVPAQDMSSDAVKTLSSSPASQEDDELFLLSEAAREGLMGAPRAWFDEPSPEIEGESIAPMPVTQSPPSPLNPISPHSNDGTALEQQNVLQQQRPHTVEIVCEPIEGMMETQADNLLVYLNSPNILSLELPFEELVSELPRLRAAYVSAALYPDARLRDTASGKEYGLSAKTGFAAGKVVSMMSFSNVAIAEKLILTLGQRNDREWTRVLEEASQSSGETPLLVVLGYPSPVDGTDIPSSPPPYSPPLSSTSLPRSSENGSAEWIEEGSALNAPFAMTWADIKPASVLCAAVEQADPFRWLQHECGHDRLRTPTLLSMLTEAGDRMLAVPGAAQPYMLAMSLDEGSAADAGRPPFETLWIVFPSRVDISLSSAPQQLRVEPPIGHVHGGLYSQAASIASDVRRFSLECRKRRQADEPADSGRACRLIMVGHALGGSLAQLVCLQLMLELESDGIVNEQVGCIAFASPWVVSDSVAATVQRRPGWQERFITVMHDEDVVPHLLTGAFDYDAGHANLSDSKPLTETALSTLIDLAAVHSHSESENTDKDLSPQGCIRRLNEVVCLTQQHHLRAVPTYAPIGVYVWLKQQNAQPASGNPTIITESDPTLIRRRIARLSGGEAVDVKTHALSNYRRCLDTLTGERKPPSRRSPAASRHSLTPGNPRPLLLTDMFLPVLELVSAHVTSRSALFRLSTRNQHFLRSNGHACLMWADCVGRALIPPIDLLGTSASIRIVDERELEIRIATVVDTDLLEEVQQSRKRDDHLTVLTLPSVFEQPARVSFDCSRVVIKSSRVRRDEMRSLPAELFMGGLLRVLFECVSTLQHSVGDRDSATRHVVQELAGNRKMIWYKELFALVSGPAVADGVEEALKAAVLAELHARSIALSVRDTLKEGKESEDASSQQSEWEELKAAVSMSAATRARLNEHLNPAVGSLLRVLEAPPFYELQPDWFQVMAKGADVALKVMKVSAALSYTLVGVVVQGGASLLGPTSRQSENGTSVPAAEVGINANVVGPQTAMHHLVHNQGLEWIGSERTVVRGYAGSPYRAHLLMLLAALRGNDDPNTVLFTANDIETAILDRLKMLRPSLYKELTNPKPSTYIHSLKNSADELKACWKSDVFKHTSEDRDASLGRFTGESQMKALRFLRAMACIHQLRQELSHAVYLSVVGAKGVGKSTLVHSLFRIPTKAGALLEDTTLELNMYPLFDQKDEDSSGTTAAPSATTGASFYLLDTPGVTDANPTVALTFRDTKAMVSLHLVLGKVVVGGAGPETDILSSLDPAVPALVILNQLEDYVFPPDYSASSGADVPPSFYRNHLAKLQHDAAVRLKMPDESIFLLYNDRLYSGSHHTQMRQRGKLYDGQSYLREHNIDALRVWLVERITNHLYMRQHTATIKKYIDYQFR
jgi:hypothetical protein